MKIITVELFGLRYLVLQLKKTQDENHNGTAPGSKKTEMEEEKFMANDGDENLDSDEAIDLDGNISDISSRMRRNANINPEMTSQSDEKSVELSSRFVVQNSELPEV